MKDTPQEASVRKVPSVPKDELPNVPVLQHDVPQLGLLQGSEGNCKCKGGTFTTSPVKGFTT